MKKMLLVLTLLLLSTLVLAGFGSCQPNQVSKFCKDFGDDLEWMGAPRFSNHGRCVSWLMAEYGEPSPNRDEVAVCKGLLEIGALEWADATLGDCVSFFRTELPYIIP